jgi:hypothetical protein
MMNWIQFFYYYYIPLKRFQEECYNKLFPYTYIYEISYIPHGSLKLYRYITDFSNLNGFIFFKYWDPSVRDSYCILLETEHLLKALCITDTKIIQYMNHDGIIKLCNEYIKKVKKQDILDITLNQKNIYDACKSYMPSLSIANNITPLVLSILHAKEFIDDKEIVVKHYDYFLNETVVKNNSYIIQI